MSKAIKQKNRKKQAIAQSLDDIKQFYPVSTSQIIEANEKIAGLVGNLKQLEELKKQLLFREDAIKLEVMNYMQDYSSLKFGDCLLVSWKTQTRQGFDLPAFKQDYPALYESFLKEQSIRVFRLL